VKYDLDNTFETLGVIKPEADLMTITKTAKEEVKNLTVKDVVVVVWGGTEDVERNETTNGFKQLMLEKITIQILFKCVSHIDLTYMCILV
jgi:hypothetical protein